MMRIEVHHQGFKGVRGELFRQMVLADFHNELRQLRNLDEAFRSLEFPFFTGKPRKKALRSTVAS